MKQLCVIFLICFTLPYSSLFAQEGEKIEREYRAKKREVPQAARDWLNDAFEGFKRVRWYREENEAGQSFEAKFKRRGTHYSVEFTTSGEVVDVEVLTKLDELPEELQRNIASYLDSDFSRYRILRLQRQLSGDAEVLEDYFDENEDQGVTVKYEVEIEGQKNDELGLFELLFDARGKLLQWRTMQAPPTNNLDY